MCIEYKDKYECVDYRTYIMGIAEYPCPCDKCCFNTNKKQTMGKAEKFIQDCTRNCSNELCAVEDRFGKKVISYHEWLTPDQARRAVEIAREETLQDVKSKLLHMLNTSIDNEHFFEQLDEYIEEI